MDKNNKKEWHFKGIKQHHVMQFPILDSNRRETIEDTLNTLSKEEEVVSNTNCFPRTTYLFKSDPPILEEIVKKIKLSSSFNHCDVIHSASDLGITHMILAEHQQSKAIISFDGLYIRVTKEVTTDSFNINELLSKTGIPWPDHEIINDFIVCIQKIYPDKNIYGHTFYNYYTIDETSWNAIGLTRQGDAQVRLILNDPNIFTITASISSKAGRDFHVYLGDKKMIHQMIAHDFFMEMEIRRIINFFHKYLKQMINYQESLKKDFGGIIAPIWRIIRKHKLWDTVKETLRSLYDIKDFCEKGNLLVKAIEELIENRIAFFNGPRQIWVEGDKRDSEETIQHQNKHFFEGKIENSHIKIQSDQPSEPFYARAYNRLKRKLKHTSDLCDEVYQRERDLLTAYQTEFALYAVWIALLALAIAISSILRSQ